MQNVIDWLREKTETGVKQVRVTSVLAKLEDAQAEARRNGGRRAKKPKQIDVVGTAEAAMLLGVERARIGKWRRKGILLGSGERIDFPAAIPVMTTCAKVDDPESAEHGQPDHAKLAATPLWWADDVRVLKERIETAGVRE